MGILLKTVHIPKLTTLKLIFFLLLVGAPYVIAQKAAVPQKENLGPSINSSYDEVLPVISADGKTLYFVRKDCPENFGGKKDDIWFSTLQSDGTWSKAQNIGYPLNTDGINYVCSALPDNNTLLLGNQYFRDRTQKKGVSLTTRTETGWSFPRNLIITGYENKSDFCEYAMSPDTKVLVMSIETGESYGRRHLYVSFLKKDSTWTKPENMGKDINCSEADIAPFIAADGVTLYFSSSRPGGFGSNDVYFSRRLDDTWKHWSKPKNLGYPINTAGWDAYYTIPAVGDYAYFVSNTDGFGASDIFRIKLPKEVKPLPVALVIGTVKDDSGHVVPARIEYERLTDSIQTGSATAHPQTGEYSIALTAGANYGFRAMAEGYYPVSANVDLTELKEYQEIRKDLVLVKIKTGQTIRLNNIFFAFNEANLLDESRIELDRLVTFLREQPKTRIMIKGHTDSVGTEQYNLRLSQQRAQAVVDYLLSKEIATERLEAKGYGKSKHIAPNDTEEGRQMNRRVEFTIVGQ
jgi:outer membrane protein OmpA-like peptidoglycan-associated protein